MQKTTPWRVAVINDQHIPFHDMKCLSLAVNIMKDANVDEIVINGDWLDCYKVSSHGPTHPDIKETLESEIQEGKKQLELLRKTFPDQKIHYIFGNHEHRLERFILNNCPTFWNLVRLEVLLDLDRLNITWQPYNSYYELNENIRVQHSPPSYSVNGARTSLLKKLDCSYIWGCTHRTQHASLTSSKGETYHAWFNGCMIDFDSKVFDYTKGHHSWQKSMMIVDVINEKEFHAHQIHLNNHKATFGNNHYDFS